MKIAVITPIDYWNLFPMSFYLLPLEVKQNIRLFSFRVNNNRWITIGSLLNDITIIEI